MFKIGDRVKIVGILKEYQGDTMKVMHQTDLVYHNAPSYWIKNTIGNAQMGVPSCYLVYDQAYYRKQKIEKICMKIRC